MRQSLLFSGLDAVSHNINRKRNDLKLFEFGKTYHDYNGTREEYKHLTFLVTGNKTHDSWTTATQKSDFFYLKGTIISTLERLGITRFQESSINNDLFSEGLQINFGKTKLVDFGLVKKSILKHFSITQEVLFADFNWDSILDIAKRKRITFI